ncbi:hypothetical protein MKW94_030286 [Papaver nudicaule]|uniref:Uncharacterized protein n=1 Tax=Papaver nudicaule TaxID=74823 RepID=A0AA42AWS9_PAPNU|nr:hypothetical protein [Papaver nudicaule]
MENMDVPFGCATRRTAHTAANRAGPSCKRNRCEDYHKAGDSVKRNKPDGFGENVCKPWVFRFKRQRRLVIIDSDSESSDRDDQNPGDSAEHNDSDDNEIISCKPWAFDTINSDSERDVGCTMPTQPKSASHGGNHKISKTEVKAKCPEQDAKNCATHKVDVSEREFQRAKRVIEEAKAFKSKFPTCTIIMKPSHLRKDCHVYVPSEFTRDFLEKAEIASNTINSDTDQSEDGYPMPTKSPSHGGNNKNAKTGEVHCQRAMSVIKEARAFNSEFPTCTIIMAPSYLQKGHHVVLFLTPKLMF